MTEIESLLSIYEKMLDEYKIRIIKKDGSTDKEEEQKTKVKVKKIEKTKNRI